VTAPRSTDSPGPVAGTGTAAVVQQLPRDPSEARDAAIVAVNRGRSWLLLSGWRVYKTSELIDPTEQWAIRTNYSGSEMHVQVKRFNPEGRRQHVADEGAWWTITAEGRLTARTPHMSDEFRRLLVEGGVDLDLLVLPPDWVEVQ
jgi:hypothetical protein